MSKEKFVKQRTLSLDISVIFSHHSFSLPSIVLSHPSLSPSFVPSVPPLFPLSPSHTISLPLCPWCLLIAKVHTRASLNVLAFMSCLCCEGRSSRYCKLIRLSPPPFVRVCEVSYYYISPLSDSCPHPPPPLPPLGVFHWFCLFLVILRMASAWLNTGLRAD